MEERNGNPFIPLARRSATTKDTIHRTVIADVDGRRYIVTALIFPWTTQAERDEIERVLAAIRIPTD